MSISLNTTSPLYKMHSLGNENTISMDNELKNDKKTTITNCIKTDGTTHVASADKTEINTQSTPPEPTSQYEGRFKSFKIENPNLNPELRQKLENLWSNCKTESEKLGFIDMYALTFASSPGDASLWGGDNWKQSLKQTIDDRRGFMASATPETRLLLQEHEKWFNKLF